MILYYSKCCNKCLTVAKLNQVHFRQENGLESDLYVVNRSAGRLTLDQKKAILVKYKNQIPTSRSLQDQYPSVPFYSIDEFARKSQQPPQKPTGKQQKVFHGWVWLDLNMPQEFNYTVLDADSISIRVFTTLNLCVSISGCYSGQQFESGPAAYIRSSFRSVGRANSGTRCFDERSGSHSHRIRRCVECWRPNRLSERPASIIRSDSAVGCWHVQPYVFNYLLLILILLGFWNSFTLSVTHCFPSHDPCRSAKRITSHSDADPWLRPKAFAVYRVLGRGRQR